MAGPPMMPGAGGGGGDIANQLMQLIEPIMQSPKGQMMVQALMSQMGGGGGGMAAMMGGGTSGGMPPMPGGGAPLSGAPQGRGGPMTDSDLEGMMQTRNQMRPDMPPQEFVEEPGGPADMAPRQTPMPTTEDEMNMVQQMMGGGGGGAPGGGGGMNSDGPTPQEIQMLKSSPSPRNMQNFDKLFGPGAAEAALAGGGGGGGPAGGGGPPKAGSSYEDDVRGAMTDGDRDPLDAEDEGDHEYR